MFLLVLISDLSKQIDDDAKEYLEKVKTLSPEQRVDRLNTINAAFAKSREFGDDKVQLAMQTYEMVSFETLITTVYTWLKHHVILFLVTL